jgi:hypothetical protein
MPPPQSSFVLAIVCCLGMCSLGSSLGCADLLGIEEARCDAEYSADCTALPPSPASGESGAAPDMAISALKPGGPASDTASAPDGEAMSGAVSGVAASLCDRYCLTIAANCAGGDQQYASPEACHAVCQLLEPGEPGDRNVNSVQCRLNRAELAASTGEPANYCFSAGPGGAGECGTDCEGFCSVMTAQCTQLGTWEECLDACSAVPDLSGPPANVTYNTSVQEGDSVQCRLFHVSAASLDPVGHCVHAAGIAVCGGP